LQFRLEGLGAWKRYGHFKTGEKNNSSYWAGNKKGKSRLGADANNYYSNFIDVGWKEEIIE